MSFFRFTPDMMDSEDLFKLSVGRKKVISDLMIRLKEHATKKIPFHLIFIGPRGIGKSHLLLLIYYNIISSDLSQLINPIKLSEEEYSIASLSDLFSRILEEADNCSFPDKNLIVEKGIQFLKETKNEKMSLLLIDNFNLLFQQIPEEDLNRFRSILQENPNLMIIGAAPAIFGELTNYDHPFYNFFEIQFMKELTRIEIKKLIKTKLKFEEKDDILKKFEDYNNKIEAITILTGGNPRLILSLCEILCKPNKIIDVENALLRLLDGLTPYYQSKMVALPTQQRKIFDILATSKGPLSPKEISLLANYPVNIINVQLKRLQDSGYVEQIKLRKKKTVKYEVKERLFRIWREMRFPFGRKRISLFVQFLELWFTKKELIEQYTKMLHETIDMNNEYLKKNKLSNYLWYLQEAVGPPRKYLMASLQILKFIQSNQLDLAQKQFDVWKKEIKNDKMGTAFYYCIKSIYYLQSGDYEKSEKYAQKASNLDVKESMLYVNFVLTLSLYYSKKYAESLKYSEELIALGNADIKQLGHSFKSRNLLKLKKYDEALNAINDALMMNHLAEYWYIKGNILKALKKVEAIDSYTNAIELEPNNDKYVSNRALYASKIEHEKAREWIDDAISRNPENVMMLLEKCRLLNNEEDFENEEKIVVRLLNIQKKLQHPLKIQRNTSIFHVHLLAKLIIQKLDKKEFNGAKNSFITYLKELKELNFKNYNEELIPYFMFLYEHKKFSFICETFGLIREHLGADVEQALKPLLSAAEYIKTENVDILEALQKEERTLLIEIVEKYSSKTKIPKNLKT